MGILFPQSNPLLAQTESTLLFIAVVILVYSALIVIRGLYNFADPNYVGVLTAGFAGKLPLSFRINVPKRLAVLVANSPGVLLPLMLDLKYFNGPGNNIILALFFSYYALKMSLGFVTSGYGVNIVDVLLEFSINFSFAYAQSAALCFLYDYSSVLQTPFYVTGLSLYVVGFAIHFIHEVKLWNLETMFEARIPYARGALFELVVTPQYFGDMLMIGGIAVSTQTICGLAHFAFITAYYMVISNIRYAQLKDQLKDDFNNDLKRLVPFVW